MIHVLGWGTLIFGSLLVFWATQGNKTVELIFTKSPLYVNIVLFVILILAAIARAKSIWLHLFN